MDTAVRPARWSLVVAGLLHLAALWLYWLSVLVAPFWATVALLVLWLVLTVVLVRVHSRYGAVALAVPLAAVALWFAVVSAGSALLGWTA
jgi:hypothetical protein